MQCLRAMSIALGMLFCSVPLACDSSSADQPASLPATLANCIRVNFPVLNLLNREQALPEILSFVASKKPKQLSPFVCSADFDGDGKLDFALLMREQEKGSLKLMAFHNRGTSYQHFLVEDMW
jgi:hypothetical protein